MNVFQSTQASNTSLAIEDFDQLGTTEGATRIDIGSITTSAYNDWTLDSDGLGWISKTGYTSLGVREGHDALNSATALVNNTTNEIVVNTSGSGSNKPKLVVTYVFSGNFLPFL